MPKVYNWQLGREMLYPYEESHPQEQFAFVFNINRCIGCQTCSMACKSTWTFSRGQEYMWWNNVESAPYGGYPKGWDVKLLSLLEKANPGGQLWNRDSSGNGKSPYGLFGGKTVFEAVSEEQSEEGETQQETSGRVLGYLPTDEEWMTPNVYEDTARRRDNRRWRWGGEGVSLPEHKTWFMYLQRICNHCTYPGCLAACPRQAIYKRPEDGVVLIDQERCRGYRKCVEACPYKKAMYRGSTRTSEKCVACYPRLEGKDKVITPDGAPLETRCMCACVGKIRMQGMVDIAGDGSWKADSDNPLYYMIKEEKVALPLYPQFGTEPNGYYIPPRWVPNAYLNQMFGPGAERAVAAYVYPSRRLLALLQLFRVSQKIIFRFGVEEGKKIGESEVTMPDGTSKTLELFNDTAIGYDGRGREIIRVTVEEPVYERSKEYSNSI
jgi:nitrate reductase beta subunit